MRAARGLGAGAAFSSSVRAGVSATLRRSWVAAAFIAEVTLARSCLSRVARPLLSICTRCTEP